MRMKFLESHKNWKTLIWATGTIVFIALCTGIFSKQEIYISNGIIHENTWRYRVSISKADDDFLVSSFDKITRESEIKTFSASKEKAVRTVIVKERQNRLTIYGEDGECLYDGVITESDDAVIAKN